MHAKSHHQRDLIDLRPHVNLIKLDLRSAQTFAMKRSYETDFQSLESLVNQRTAYALENIVLMHDRKVTRFKLCKRFR